MSTKHTPGPWRSNGRFVGNMNHMSCVAECRDNCGNWSDDELARANARLIAAAPELLSLLQDWVNDFADCLEGGESEELVIFSRAVIAKATGGDT